MLTPIKAIRVKCLDCCCGSAREVELCPILDCSLYPYRFGKNPNIKLSDAQSPGATGEGNYTPDTEKATEGHADA